MQQHLKTWLLAVFIVVGITGCSSKNNNTANEQGTDGSVSIGYYSNEKHDRDGGNAVLLDNNDNDGPAIEMMDHTFGGEADSKKKINPGENMIGGTDRNYHGHISNNQQPKWENNKVETDSELVTNINNDVKSIDNVSDARTIVYKDNVIVGVLLKDANQKEDTKNKVLSTVKETAKGKKIKVLTNESQFNRIKAISNDLNNSGSDKGLINEIQNIIK